MDDLVGRTLGRYRLDRLLGQGGMGAVFKAHDPTLDLDVAIKVMHPHLAQGPTARRRFLQEARTAVRLNHPGIVRFFDVAEADSRLFIVMEFIPGETLRKLLDRHRAQGRQMSSEEAVRLVRQVCLALDHAHQQGILHRDIKPENIMLRPIPGGGLPYSPVITDLGLARLGGRDLTVEGMPMGTLAYMSPEQAQGLETDTRSDVYSLGVLLFELAVGRQPFPARTITEAIRYHTLEPPPRPRSLRPELSRALEDVILATLSKDPRERPRDAGVLGTALEELLDQIVGQEKEGRALSPTPGDAVSLSVTYQQSLVEPPAPPPADRFPEPVGLDQARVVALLPDGSSYVAAVRLEGVIIGRAPDAGLVLDDKYVSRHHLRVDIKGERAEITDLKSTHGTFLGETLLLPGIPETWHPDQMVYVGRTWLRLQLPSPVAPAFTSGLTDASGVPVPDSQIVSSAGARRIGLFLEQKDLSVTPGSSAIVSLTILNQGPIVDRFHISVEGVPDSWLPVPPPSVSLLPAQNTLVPIALAPPRSPDTGAGRRNILIRVTSDNDPQELAQAKASVAVAGFSLWRSRLAPLRITAGEPAKVEVENQGNQPQPVSVTWRDRAEELSFEPQQAQLTVPPGESVPAPFRAVPRRRRWLGGEKRYPIAAGVASPDGQMQSHTGEVVSGGRIPIWLLPALGLFVAIGVAAVLVLPHLPSGVTPTPEPPVTEAGPEETAVGSATVAPDQPTEAPTNGPTLPPTDEPTQPPTDEPTEPPTEEPTESPTDTPPPAYVCTDPWGCVEVPEGEAVRIAFAGPLTGPLSAIVDSVSHGCELALSEYSDILGFPVALVIADTEGTAEGGVAVANRMVAEERLVGVVGHTMTGSTLSAIPVYEEAGIVMVSPTTRYVGLPEIGPNVFNRVSLSDEQEAHFTVDYIFDTLRLRSVYIMHDSDAYWQGLAQVVSDDSEERGGTVVGMQAVSPGMMDPSALVVRLEALIDEGTELVYYAGTDPGQVANLATAMWQAGISGLVFFGNDTLYSQSFIDQAGSAADGTYAVSTRIRSSAAYDQFQRDYEDAYGIAPANQDSYSAYGYDAAAVLLASVQEVAVESHGTLYVPRKALAEALRSVSGFGGLTGRLTNDGKGNLAASPPVFVVVRNGQWVEAPAQ